MLAVEAGSVGCVRALLEWDRENKVLLEQRDGEFGRTALMWAAEAGTSEAASLLVAAGADKDAQCEAEGEMQSPTNVGTYSSITLDFTGRSSLMICAENGSLAVAKVLVSAGADRELKDLEGRTAREIAIGERKKGCEEVAELLSK